MDTQVFNEEGNIYNGVWRFFESFDTFDLSLDEIALRLARMKRYCCKGTYTISVAQHSVMLAVLLIRQNPKISDVLVKQAMLHEVIETQTGDVCGLLKRAIPGIRYWENEALAVVLPKFGLPPKLDPIVEKMDKHIRNYEVDAMKTGVYKLSDNFDFTVWDTDQAYRYYLKFWSYCFD